MPVPVRPGHTPRASLRLLAPLSLERKGRGAASPSPYSSGWTFRPLKRLPAQE